MEQLNHRNPEYVTWKHEEILFALLGGIRIEGLHSMRVTLKIDFKTYPSIRHSLDLYNETQTEDYRLQQIDSNKLKSNTNKPTLSKAEIEEAEAFLKIITANK